MSVRAGMGRAGWMIAVGAMLGNIPGLPSILFLTQSLFMAPMIHAFGWSQTAFLAPMAVALVCNGLLQPVLGAAVDRRGVKVVMLPLLLMFGLSAMAMALVSSSYIEYLVLTVAVGVLALGQSPLLYGRIIAARLPERRGFAMSIALSGVAVGNLLLPQLASHLIAAYGWRWARAGLGLSVFLIAVPAVWLLLPEPPRVAAGAVQASHGGGVVRAPRLGRRFWQIAAAIFLSTLALGGHAATLAGILAPRGLSLRDAAVVLSALAVGQLVGQLLCGRLLDAVPHPAIGSVWLILGACGIVTVDTAHGIASAIAGGALIGMAFGAPLGMAAYFTTRFFDLAAYGRIYGFFITLFTAGLALGPLILGLGHDRWGSYSGVSLVLGAGLLIATLLVVSLGRYRSEADQNPHKDGLA